MNTRSLYPLIALWAHPRSMSTATERVMRERGDCKVFHEPFLPYYYKHVAGHELPMYDQSLVTETDFDQIRDILFAAAAREPVFFKDMSYYVVPRAFSDQQFCSRLHHVFLIRDPRRSIASYYKLDPDFTRDELGLEAQWQHFSHLESCCQRTPLVIEAESLAQQPMQIMRSIWEYCGLPFVASAFDWQAQTIPGDWRYVEGWHKQVVASSGIRADNSDAESAFGRAAEQAPRLNQYLQYHLPFYQKLKSRALYV